MATAARPVSTGIALAVTVGVFYALCTLGGCRRRARSSAS